MKNKSFIGLKELRENTEAYIRRVDRGESITVMRRSTPLFRITPVDADEAVWETLADFSALDEQGVSARDILAAIRKQHG